MNRRRSVVLVVVASTLVGACSSDGPAGASARDASVDAAVEAGPPAAHPDASVTDRDGSAVSRRDAAVEAAQGNTPYPRLLSQTGLFSDVKAGTLAKGVRAFQPKYALWSDGATKRRWLSLPAGATIDTSDMDYWKYPAGTKVWKEFTRGGKRVETRLLHKAGPNATDWVMMAYQWNDALTDAEAVPDGVVDARGTPHDIPSQTDCERCHTNMPDRLLGVTALQLSHPADGSGVTITDLIAEGRLTHPPTAPIVIPGGAPAEPALGYLHANCGHCHNPRSAVSATVALDLWESTQALGTVAGTTGYRTTVLQPNSFLPQYHVIEPGKPAVSELVLRIDRRGVGQMPPLATDVIDDAGVQQIRAWVGSLQPVPDGGTADSGVARDGGL